MDACYQRLSNTAQSIWANLAYCAEGVKGSAYKVSNYVLGGTFRNILFTLPQQTASTTQSCEDFLNSSLELPSTSHKNVLENFDIYTKDIEVDVNGVCFFIQARIYETRDTHEMIHTCIRVGGKDETLKASDIRVYPLLKAYVKTMEKTPEQKNLRIIQFSLHGHRFGEGKQSWQPNDVNEIGDLYFVTKTKCTCIMKTHVLPLLKSVDFSIGQMIFYVHDFYQDI